ncbi:MAG TPA: ATP-binding protein [Thermodesulfobacteriota bacterium]|nr:ATP-binding protein [Thermodesulfobacteriota bacterium]
MNYSSDTDKGLKVFVVLRVIVITLLVGTGAFFYFKIGLRNEAILLVFIIFIVYFLSFLYLLLYPLFQKFVNWFKGIQVSFDIIIASAVIYVTGGMSSPFIFFYALIIIFANIMLTRNAGYVAATSSAALYLIIVLYQLHQEYSFSIKEFPLSPIVLEDKELTYAFFKIAGFLFVAMLSGYLSERMRLTRKELRESKENLVILENLHENILQNLISGVITLDLQRRLISINKTALEILGITSVDKVMGKELNNLIPMLSIEKSLTKRSEESLHSTTDGRHLTLEFSSSILKNSEGETGGYIIIFQDITEVKELEKRLRASEKMALMGQLAAGLAHEIRNPLSSISGAIEVLCDEVKPTEDNTHLLNVVTQEVQRLNLLVEDFLLFARPIQKPEVSVDISQVIDKTVELFSSATHGNGLQVVVNTEEELYVQVDPYRLKQVIWNLLLNAIQAMPNGGKIVVEAHLEEGDVVIKVLDEGCGINEGVIPRIFEPFFTTKGGGTGLGLAIVKRVVEGHDGRINVISSEDRGTAFIITLPKGEKLIKEIVH